MGALRLSHWTAGKSLRKFMKWHLVSETIANVRACLKCQSRTPARGSETARPSTPHGASPRLLCPRDPLGKHTGVGCHFLLQGIFLTQGLNPQLLHQQADSLSLCHLGRPWRGHLTSNTVSARPLDTLTQICVKVDYFNTQ